MTKEVLQKAIDEVKWFHTMDLPYYDKDKAQPAGFLTTPGVVGHSTLEAATERFGMPKNMKGTTVLDVGAWDGFFSFEAERRGAKVVAIDPSQNCSNMDHNSKGFHVAAAALGSTIQLWSDDLRMHRLRNLPKYDVVLYYGILYHTDDPVVQLKYLHKVTGHYALIESAVLPNRITYPSSALWMYAPGFNGDLTNKWYPTIDALIYALRDVGFKRIERVHRTADRSRVTLKAFTYDI